MAGEKILIVDDEPDLIYLLSFDVKKRGYQVVTASNGEEGLAKALAEKPDLILFDIKMPKMDGFTFVRHLRKNSEMRSIPLVALTSYEPMREMFEIEGVSEYFVKSAAVDGLFEAIARLLSDKQRNS